MVERSYNNLETNIAIGLEKSVNEILDQLLNKYEIHPLIFYSISIDKLVKTKLSNHKNQEIKEQMNYLQYGNYKGEKWKMKNQEN